MVAYTGPDTKIMLNSGNYRFKLSRMEGVINKVILFNIGLMLTINFILLIENRFWLKKYGANLTFYAFPYETIDLKQTTFYLFFSFFLLLNNFIPLAMVVT